MVNFEIRVIDRETSISEGCIRLGFFSDVRQKLVIKDIRFYPRSIESKITSIIPVFLGNGEVIETFNFPNAQTTYDKLEFLLKRDGSKGWNVSVELNTDAIPVIEDSPFQVL